MILFGYHIYETDGKVLTCSESSAKIQRTHPDLWVTCGDADKLNTACPGHKHHNRNGAAYVFAEESGWTYGDEKGPNAWTEADEIGAVTLHDTSAAA